MQGYHKVKLFQLTNGEVTLEPGWKPFAYTKKLRPWEEVASDEYVVCRKWVRLGEKTVEDLLTERAVSGAASRRRRDRHLALAQEVA